MYCELSKRCHLLSGAVPQATRLAVATYTTVFVASRGSGDAIRNCKLHWYVMQLSSSASLGSSVGRGGSALALKTWSGREKSYDELSEVLIVPGARYNLLSVNAMVAKGVNVEGRSARLR
jgi:hypothetical protein